MQAATRSLHRRLKILDLTLFYYRKETLMAFIINKDDCIQCGACEAECPQGAISEIDGFYVVDPEKCEDCGSCADVCPSNSIAAA